MIENLQPISETPMGRWRSSKVPIACFVGVALPIALAIKFQSSRKDEASIAHQRGVERDHDSKVVTLIGAPQVQNLRQSSGNQGGGLAALLRNYELTENFKFLEEALERFPDEPEVNIQMALLADSADSEWLARLEDLQPGNALPNLIRASFYAEDGNGKRFSEEMESAMAKPYLETNLMNKLARIVDQMLDSGEFPHQLFGDGSLGTLDREFSRRTGSINVMFRNNRSLLGDEDTTNALALAWAKTMQNLPGLDLLNRDTGTWLEMEILNRYSMNDFYGDSGLTVGERRNQLAIERSLIDRKLVKYHEVILTDRTDSPLKRQFLTRVRSDGEMAAVNWLMTQ